MPYLPECFPRPLFDLSQTARLPCLGNREAMLGWNGDTTIMHPVDEAGEVERARKELEVKARAQLSGMVAISATFNKQERGQGHGTHKDPKDVCAIIVYTITGEATLTLSRHGNRAVLTQPLAVGSAYVLEGRGVTEFDHAISAPKNGGHRVCLVIRYCARSCWRTCGRWRARGRTRKQRRASGGGGGGGGGGGDSGGGAW